jgi:hypothetical protein
VGIVYLLWRAFLKIMIQLLRQREFMKHFDITRNNKVPMRQTILNCISQFRSTAFALPKKNPFYPLSVCNPENVERVRVALQQSPRRSAR